MKILVAVPTFENIYPDTFKSVYDIDRDGHDVIFEYIRGYDCATARNKIAQTAISYNTDYVLMVDNDVVVPSDIIKIMLDDPKDVVLGYYAHRNADNKYTGNTCICKLTDDNGINYFNYPLESEYTADDMKKFRENGRFKIQIHGGGMGCAFIKTDVFRRINYPWYDWVNYADDHRGMLSEDLYFCEACKKKQIPIYTDSRAACGHMFRFIQYCD